ncbi:MAG TPA: DedA family protein [Symbiobacteriaceae bacterium]|nr:DedA family protein [Symbiobacteriaceae bacterium]
MPAALSEWFHQHYYIAILVATVIEGLGLPLPAETLFIASGALVHRGEASLSAIILLAATGNTLGALFGFSLAYLGGRALLERAAEMLRLKPESLAEVDRFLAKYGSATIFISRFVGFIRAATIYSTGAARVEPWRFAGYTFAAALIWNGTWAFVAYQFGAGLHHLFRRVHFPGRPWALVLIGVVIGAGIVLLVKRRRNPAGS